MRTGLRALLTAAAAVVLSVPMAFAWSRRLMAGERLIAVMVMVVVMVVVVMVVVGCWW